MRRVERLGGATCSGGFVGEGMGVLVEAAGEPWSREVGEASRS